MNRFLELVTGSRYQGTGAYVTTAVRVIAGVLFVTFSIGKFSDHMSEAMDFDHYGVPWADVAVPSLCSGLMITRIGCYLFGCDFGARMSQCPSTFSKRRGVQP